MCLETIRIAVRLSGKARNVDKNRHVQIFPIGLETNQICMGIFWKPSNYLESFEAVLDIFLKTLKIGISSETCGLFPN